MVDEIKDFYTKEINNFMAKFDDLNEVDTNIIEEGLQAALKLNPGIDFVYGADTKLNETTGNSERKVELKKIHILYSYDDTKYDQVTGQSNSTPRIGKITYLVN